MINKIGKFAGIVSALALMPVGQDAFAGFAGTITYSPVPLSIPTLSGVMLMVLAFLFAVLAFRALRAHPGGKPLASLLALGVLALAATSGNQVIQTAQAIFISDFVFDSAGGGSVQVSTNGLRQGQNTSGKPIRIISVEPSSVCRVAVPTGSNLPQCNAGLELQTNGICYVDFEPQACGG